MFADDRVRDADEHRFPGQRVVCHGDPESFRFGAATRIARTMVSLALHQAGRGPAPVPYDRRGGARRLRAQLRRLGFA